ncbi:pentatricopeptide repeat-containing protein At1g19720 [Actinidia eriantha]|uniref:pentatricopeptide repeat-containing protein At1g19720 n=1 Tax=Actinidia eriantha TaxID=165200 RepID=UPI002585DFFD|nr:pentatricopeptide repeat-containing protein At1g19720 [Actinidia eriantha]XP_057470114.1 pentatricopeptide repeat-containing protein At1g19720 [Actinidia eriantha]XP_057470115.1 pentatricopeptide repeat-containing protein At1g19720 [Actinidia eriantha]XP_057470116.1 pentatricopeptide repeat-containing protein At1g19720 [Actinidia eriantha]XP_057470117.1 pentatricopeptide repeat-containing protein At1g19720 [Actinidia eriantha]XP_057470118.1 pentatricopeptide repeat-containing protein At1g19
MDGLILSSNSSSPLATSFKASSEFSSKPLKPKISVPKTQEPVSVKPGPRITDSHLNYLCKNGRLSEAIAALDSIAQCGSKVKPHTFTRLIQSCTDANSIHLGRKIHEHIGLLSEIDQFVVTKLVGMYAKCGSLVEARQVFDEMGERNLFTWSAMIGACSREGKWREVVKLFYSMMEDGVVPDNFLFPKILQACGNCGDGETGKLIHSIVIRSGMSSKIRVSNSILAVYAKCGRLSLARRLFEKMEGKDEVSWNSIISGYCLKGEIQEARRLLNLMREDGIDPVSITWNMLITSYNQLGNCELAVEVMKEMESLGITPDVITWTSMISGFAHNNRTNQALELYREMILAGVEPNKVTLATAISACASLKALREGMELHSIAVKIGIFVDIVVNSVIDMYSKCGKLEAAQRVFDTTLEKDVYTWNSMIGGYCQAGYLGKAHDLFMKMHGSDVSPNAITWNIMITGYMENGEEDQAMDLFQRMEKDGTVKRDTASWNSIISGYLQNGHKNKALGIFRQMQSLFVRPNSVTILSLLPACANLVAVKKIKEIHGCVFQGNLESDLSVANALIDSYAKAGNIVYSRTIFDRMQTKDIITWNTMIASYVLHGCPHPALEVFDQMKKVGLKPNRGTFVYIISACGLAGMVDEGKQIFSSMVEKYNVFPCLEHCLAMVHLFGRSGKLEEAIRFVENMAIETDFTVWLALLTAGRSYGNVGLVAYARERLLELKPRNVSIQSFALQTYALCGISEGEASETRKSLGWSWIEVKNTVHTFTAGDQSKRNSEGLYSWIRSITGKIWAPDPHDGRCIEEEEEEKEEIGGVHSEKLAIAFALIGSPQASQSIRIMKSLRICGNCHRMAKFVSKTYGCEIYLTDSACLHHFYGGHCSCGDYW